MPNITFSYKDFQQLLGRKLEPDKFGELLLLYAKAELGKYDKVTGEVTVELDDTNMPYLWCPEGLARLFKGILGQQKGAPKAKTNSSSYRIIVEDSVKSVRPYITAFVAKGKNTGRANVAGEATCFVSRRSKLDCAQSPKSDLRIDDYLLKQLIQLQEKFCDGYGRRRQKVSIGLYSHRRIAFPVHYKAVNPASVKFAPLDFDRKLNLNEILAQHPKGQQYGWILSGAEKYPLLVDDAGEVLSFPPIVNSNFTGKLEVGDTELLFEATGSDEESINLAANIFAQNLNERGFSIYSVTVSYKGRSVIAPAANKERMKISAREVEDLTGLKLKEPEIRSLLLRVGYDFAEGRAIVPPYRADIMHPVDIIEDVAIAYGFDRIAEEPLASYTVGAKDKGINTINSLRKAAVGMGFQEIFSHILTDKSALQGENIIELQNSMSETYSAVRNSLLPQLLDVLSKNKHSDYPQKIFEEGIIAAKEGNKAMERHSLAMMSAHSKADFTEMKQYVSSLLAASATLFEIRPAEHPAFIKGRAGSIIAGGKAIGLIGEISPAVLSKWGIEMPAAAAEISLDFFLLKQ